MIDGKTRNVLVRIVVDLLILGVLKLLIYVFHYQVVPFKRGFFCDDESLMHPYHDSTVAESLYYVGFGAPFLVILITEIVRWKLNVDGEQNVKLFNQSFPSWLPNVYKNYLVFLFGMAITILTTDIGKHVVGRLRPHFFDVCRPVLPDGTNCSNPINFHRYIEDFECTNNNSSPDRLNDAKLSFPSGHSSMSMFSMLYASLYLHHKMRWEEAILLKNFLLSVFFNLAWFTALSRISDYKHHWSDVLFGSFLGLGLALIAVYGVSSIAKKSKASPRPSSTPIAINAHTNHAFEN